MSPDQEVGAALLLPTVGRPGVLDVAGAVEDGVAAGALVVGCGVGPVEGAGVLLVAVPERDDVVLGAVLRARPLVVGATGTGWTTPPAGVVVCAVVGCTFR
ncbi:MAG: hypothetical protein QOJ68_3461 [Blastococcus sp.]|jgi:hypothetical protein|nr:hypothetical protein [Blastococcus sp.]